MKLRLDEFNMKFQSTPPARGATLCNPVRQRVLDRFQSTPPARGATLVLPQRVVKGVISIHAPREGGDYFPFYVPYTILISIHAPREGGDSKDAQFYLRIFDK